MAKRRWAAPVVAVAMGLVTLTTGGMSAGAQADPPPEAAELRVGDVTAWEGLGHPSRALVPVTLDRPVDHDVVVQLATVASSATPPCPGAGDGLCTTRGDYLPRFDSVIIPAGATVRHVGITIVADKLTEDRRRQVIGEPPLQIVFEQFLLRVTVDDPAVVVVDGEGVVQIRDAKPGIAVNDVSTAEGDAGARFVVVVLNLNQRSDETVTVDYRTRRGLAVPGDFRSKQGTVVFAPGATLVQVVLPIVPDEVPELDEDFELVLSNPVGAPLGDASGLIRIMNDD